MTEQLVPYKTDASAIEAVIAKGDLAKLTPAERVNYYLATCRSLGLNELTKPFEYITLNNKLTLYATRSAADQLRKENGVSIEPPHLDYRDDLVIVTVNAHDRDGRTDTDVGAVFIGNLKGVDRANAIMKAITKAKRRVTLSICGLGWTDESEVDSIPNARPTRVDLETGEIVEAEPEPQQQNGENGGNWQADNTTLEQQKSAFFDRVLKEIPYYNHVKHVAATLKLAGFTAYKHANEEAMFNALQEHANEKANEKAEEAA